MATKPDTDKAADNGKPSRNAAAPVIRRLAVAEESSGALLLKRQMPAFVISGLIHVVLITGFLLFYPEPKDNDVSAKEAPTVTQMDEVVPPEVDLTNPDQGLDSDLEATVEVDKQADVNVDAPVVENENIGLPNQDKEFATQTQQIGALNDNVANAGAMGDIGLGDAAAGANGAGSSLALDGLKGRSGATKERLLRQGGGNDETEAAVGRALVWLAKMQTPSGHWEFDGSHKDSRIAATGMCVLPFLAAGETHMNGKRYKSNVKNALDYLVKQLKPTGQFGSAGMYEQAIATVAVCEAAGMTQDEKLKRAARVSVEFIVKAQAGNGSWGYSAGTTGDTSIVGWQIQALKSAKLAGLHISGLDKSMAQAEAFLISVSDESESGYGYASKGSTFTLSAVGLLSRIYITSSKGGNARKGYVAKGVQKMWSDRKPTDDALFDMYYYYYATQVVYFMDGKDWHQNWNPAMRKLLLDRQITANKSGVKSADVGSWPKDAGFIGGACGKVGTTALACLTLEVYYRHLPLTNREAAGGLDALEGKN